MVFRYNDKNGSKIFDWESTLSIEEQNLILDSKHIKKRLGFYNLCKERNVAEKYLCNGYLEMYVICYLGYFRKPKSMSRFLHN